MATTDNIGHTPCRTTTTRRLSLYILHFLSPMPRTKRRTARKSRGLRDGWRRLYRKDSFAKLSSPTLHPLVHFEVIQSRCSCRSPSHAFAFPHTLHLPLSLLNFSSSRPCPPPLLSFCRTRSARSDCIPCFVSSFFTNGFRVRLSHHLRASHAAFATTRRFGEKAPRSSLNEL